MSTLVDWVADPSCAGNATTLTVAGIIYANEGNDVEALKACHSGLSLEMCAPVLFAVNPPTQLPAFNSILPGERMTVTVFLVLRRMALSVQLYLKIDRLDQAEKQLKVRRLRAQMQALAATLLKACCSRTMCCAGDVRLGR